jgi:hypothetical protein
MTDLSDYELRVLRKMVASADDDLVCGAAPVGSDGEP